LSETQANRPIGELRQMVYLLCSGSGEPRSCPRQASVKPYTMRAKPSGVAKYIVR
jgi:hypothetical protein